MPEVQDTDRGAATALIVAIAIVTWCTRAWASTLEPSREGQALRVLLDVIAFACHLKLFAAVEASVGRDLGSANSWTKFLHLPGAVAIMLLFRDLFFSSA